MSVSEAARYVKDTTEQVIPVTAEVPDAADSFHNEFERVKLTQKVAIARDEGRLAEEAEGRELPERPLLEQTTLECAKENPSDLGTKVPENEPRSDRVSRLGIVAVISRFAVLWTTRAKWNCLDDTCKLTRADSASDEASGYWFKRWNGESDWNGEQVDWRMLSAHRVRQSTSLRTYGSRTKACLTSMSDAVCVDENGKQQWGWS